MNEIKQNKTNKFTTNFNFKLTKDLHKRDFNFGCLFNYYFCFLNDLHKVISAPTA